MQQWTNAFRSLPSTEAQLPLQRDQRQLRGGSQPSVWLQKCTQSWGNELWDCVFHPTFSSGSLVLPYIYISTAGPLRTSQSGIIPLGFHDISFGLCMDGLVFAYLVSMFLFRGYYFLIRHVQSSNAHLPFTWQFVHLIPAVHPFVWPCYNIEHICHVRIKRNHCCAFQSWLVSSLRTSTCAFNIFLCNGSCSSTIISLYSLISGRLHACAPHWLLCTVWSKLDVRSPHSHPETTSKTVAMGRIRKNHFGILTFSLLVTFVWTQR